MTFSETIAQVEDNIPFDCRRESHQLIQPSLGKRYTDILNILSQQSDGITARYITNWFYRKNLIPDCDLNYVKPRLTELVKMGKIEVVGKQVDHRTGRHNSLYTLVNP